MVTTANGNVKRDLISWSSQRQYFQYRLNGTLTNRNIATLFHEPAVNDNIF